MKTYFKFFAAIALLAATACNKMDKDKEDIVNNEVYSVIQVRAPKLTGEEAWVVIDEAMTAAGINVNQPVIIITGPKTDGISAQAEAIAEKFINAVQAKNLYITVSISLFDKNDELLAKRELNPLVQAGTSPNLTFQTTYLVANNGEGKSLVVNKDGKVVKTVDNISSSRKSFNYKDLGMISGNYNIDFAGKTYDVTTQYSMLAYNVVVVIR